MRPSRSLPPPLLARSAALGLLEGALTHRGGLEGALAAPALAALSPQDRAFARALAMATLRRLGVIDQVLRARLAKPPPDRVRDILRLGLAQAFFLDTPDFAAVDTSVALAPRAFRGLVNAVLRGALREGPLPDDPAGLAPDWLLARWRAQFGEAQALGVAAAIADEPDHDLSLRDPDDGEMVTALEARALGAGSIRLERRGDPASWPGYVEGRWWVQDVAAAAPARLARPAPGKTALDMCAAPGGKTLQLASAGATVTALDLSAPRLARLTANLKRTGLAAESVAVDATRWEDDRRFDIVLLDAPCSSTGAFRRHPDVLWNARPSDLASLARVQSRLLAAAAARLAPGGVLVYSVCSLEAEEGEAQAKAILSRYPELRTDPIAPGEAGTTPASLTPEGWLRLLPHHREGGQDGFFIARLVRPA
jgi:16S rRNA (cytosine967-C5)-methyltransferase